MPASWSPDNASKQEEQQHRRAGLQPDVVADRRVLAVDEVRDRRGRVLRLRAAAREQVDLAVRLERSGRRDDHDEQQRRPEHRHGDRPEPPDAACAVDRGRLVQVPGDPLQAGGHEDEREAEARPHARHRDGERAPCRGPAAARGPSRREDAAEPSRCWRARRPRAGAGTATSGSPPRPTWRPSRRTRPGTRRPRAGTCRRARRARRRRATPSGTVISAKLDGDPERVLELDAAEQVDVLVEAVRHAVVAEVVAPLLAEQHRPAERIDHEDPEDDRRRGSIAIASGKSAQRRPDRRSAAIGATLFARRGGGRGCRDVNE